MTLFVAPRSSVAVECRNAVERVGDHCKIQSAGGRAWRLDDEGAEQSPPHLARGDLVAVVPERADLLRAEPVGVALAGRDGVLSDAGDTILCIRHVDAVPVDRYALIDVLVSEDHLDEIPLLYP